MQKISTPHITRTGWFNGDLEETIKRFRSDFFRAQRKTHIVKKFLVYEQNPPQYLILVMHHPDKRFSEGDYNIALTIAADSSEYTERIFSDFKAKTSIIQLNEPDDQLKLKLGAFADMLPIFKRYTVAQMRSTIEYLLGLRNTIII